MRVCAVSKDNSVVEALTDVCREECHELTVENGWPPGPSDAARLLFLDLDSLGQLAEVDPEQLRHAGDLVLVCSQQQADQVDDALLAVAEDLFVKPIRPSALRYRLRVWDRVRRQQDALQALERRVDDLAAEADRHASVLNDVEVRQQLAGRNASRLEQVLGKMHMVTRLSRLINCLDLQTIVEACIERVPLLVGARFASLYFHDQRSGHLVLERHNHPWKIAERVDLADVVNSPMSLAIQRRRMILIRDFKEFEATEQIAIDRGFVENYATNSCIIAPLMSGHRIIGVLNLADKADGKPFDEEIDLPPIEQLCELIGASIYNIELFREVERQAKTDGLTGLANHRTFVERLTEEVGRANRYGSKLSMLMIDMDNLKGINDRLGHQAGDTALAYVARVIEKSIRATDLAARYGGDEFGVVLVETGLRQAQALADRLLQNIQTQKLVIDGQSIPVTLSVGVGQYVGDATPEHFIKRVDAALYDAKGQGKNRVATAALPPGAAEAQ
ncbi:MAG: sensor domain-containing diguanylate cyclase [Planctomycetes bacterium]|nr:sensor domain-containing diguanylate cyclase [Planctomycetota bacterium]